MSNPIGSLPILTESDNKINFLSSEKEIPKDLIYLILNHCSPRDLLSLECVRRDYRDLTRIRWKTLSVAQRLDFEWDFDPPESYPEKAKFRLGKALHAYMEARKTVSKRITTADEVATRFADIMKRFLFFGAFVYSDLSTFGKIETPYPSLFEKKITFLQSKTTAGGNLVLQSILLSHKVMDPSTVYDLFENLKKAIEAKASCASIYACQLVDSVRFYQFMINLTSLSIERFRDYRGLESLLEIDPDLKDEFYSQGIWHPPVMYLCAKTSPDDATAEYFYDKAVELYERDVPGPVLIDAAEAKWQLKKLNEAETLSQRAIVAYGDTVPARVWHIAAEAKQELKKLVQAEALYEKAIAASGEKFDELIWYGAASLKVELSKWEEAESLCKMAFIAMEDGDVFFYNLAARIKIGLKKWSEARIFNEKAIAACEGLPQYMEEVKETKKKIEAHLLEAHLIE